MKSEPGRDSGMVGPGLLVIRRGEPGGEGGVCLVWGVLGTMVRVFESILEQ